MTIGTARVLATLAGGLRPVSGLAQPFAISLPGFRKHLRILKGAGLLRHEQFFDEEARDRHEQGWTGCIGRLERLLG